MDSHFNKVVTQVGKIELSLMLGTAVLRSHSQKEEGIFHMRFSR